MPLAISTALSQESIKYPTNMIGHNVHQNSYKGKGKGKDLPLQVWTGSEVSRSLRLPDFKTTAHEGGKVVSLTHRPPLPLGNIPGTHSY